MTNFNTPHSIPDQIAEKVCAIKSGNDTSCERGTDNKRQQMTEYLSQHGKSEAVFKAVEALSAETGIDKMKILASLNLKPLQDITTDIHPKGQYLKDRFDGRGNQLMVHSGYMSGEEKIKGDMAAKGIHEINIRIHPKMDGQKPPSLTQNLPYIIGKKPEVLNNDEDQYNIYKDFYTKRIVYYVGDLVKNRTSDPTAIRNF